MWVNKRLLIFLVPSQSSSTPLYPFKVMWAKERAPTRDSSAIFSLDSHLSLSKNLGTRHSSKFWLDNLRI